MMLKVACGCALVSTDYDGAKECAVDGVNALFCKRGNASDIAKKQELCIKLSESENASIQNYYVNRLSKNLTAVFV